MNTQILDGADTLHGTRIAGQLNTLKRELKDAFTTMSQLRINQRTLCDENAQLGAAIVALARERDALKTERKIDYDGMNYESAMLAFERSFITLTLARHRGNQCKAAREMGMHRNTLRRKIAELSIDVKAGAR